MNLSSEALYLISEMCTHPPVPYPVPSFFRHIRPTQTPVCTPSPTPTLPCPVLTQTQLGGTAIVAVCNAVSGAIRGC